MKCSAPSVVFAEVVLLILFQSSVASGGQGVSDNASIGDTILNVFYKCIRKNISQCLKGQIMEYANSIHFNDKTSLLSGGLMPEYSNETLTSQDKNALQTRLEERLVNFGITFLEKSFLKLLYPTSENVRIITLRGEGRMKKLKGLRPLIIALKLNALALIPMYLHFLSTIAAKAMLIGKIALSISGLMIASKLMAPDRH